MASKRKFQEKQREKHAVFFGTRFQYFCISASAQGIYQVKSKTKVFNIFFY
jgi:hypothetical protein